jgi:hypothetical protein
MKFIAAVLLTTVFGIILGMIAGIPWWGFAVSSFLIGALLYQSAGKAFLSGFLGLFLFWAGMATWIDMQNQHLLSKKVALIFPLQGSYVLLIIVTGVLGGLIAGFSAMSGSYLRRFTEK